jgi:ABC-type transport system involved in cytochrome bd biosynthesis fused ATPase/permease subunit
MVVPDEPIVVDHHQRQAEKHLAARVLSTVMQRLDRTQEVQKAGLSPQVATPQSMPLLLGWRVDDTGRMLEPARFPLTQMVHIYISGTTGSGKSFLARVLLEEVASHKSLSILVLDPRNQSIGLLTTEDRPQVLELYELFGMKGGQARGIAFE